MKLNDLVSQFPVLFHMAEADTWASIAERGLLSTSAVLDLFTVSGSSRIGLESARRYDKAEVSSYGMERIVLRDQKPMDDSRLTRALVDGTTPRQWYELLNGKVFFWAERKRLLGLLKARHYRNLEHDVLEISTASLLGRHNSRVWLCHMNSGNTYPIPHARGIDAFKRIDEYPIKANGKPKKQVVEVVVDYSVPDIAQHVLRVRRMRGAEVLGVVHEAQEK